MALKRPEYLPGRCYHLLNRGAHRVSIFRDRDNYLFVLRRIKAYCGSLQLTPIAYCLLPNHYHLLVRQEGRVAAGLLPQRVFNSYSKAYNRRYDHSGTLFEGQYRVLAVEKDAHLVHLCRYVHANPVLHGLVDKVEDWPYSNYSEWTGQRDGTLVDRDLVRMLFSDPAAYQAFVAEYVAERRLPAELAGRLQALE